MYIIKMEMHNKCTQSFQPNPVESTLNPAIGNKRWIWKLEFNRNWIGNWNFHLLQRRELQQAIGLVVLWSDAIEYHRIGAHRPAPKGRCNFLFKKIQILFMSPTHPIHPPQNVIHVQYCVWLCHVFHDVGRVSHYVGVGHCFNQKWAYFYKNQYRYDF